LDLKKILVGIVALLVLGVAAVFILPGLIDWNAYRDDIAELVREATGRDVAIEGDLRLSLLPRPALTVQGVKLGNAKGASDANMLELERLDVNVRLQPLLSRHIEVESIRLVRPVVVLEKMKDGRVNWVFEPERGANDREGGQAAAVGAGVTEDLKLSLGRFEISEGRVIYRDNLSETEESIEDVEMSGSVASLSGPFDVAGRARVRGLPVFFDLSLGRLEPGRGAALKLTLRGEHDLFNASYKGRIEEPLGAAKLSGDLAAATPNLLQLLARAGVAAPKGLARKVAMESRLLASAEEVALNDLRLRLDDISATGAVSAAFADEPSFDIALDVKRLDLDKFLAATGAAGQKGGAKGDPKKKTGADIAQLKVPGGIKGSVSLTIDGVTYRESLIRQVNVQAAIDNGRLELSRLSALLPGGSDVAVSGVAENADGGPSFSGRADIAADNLRGLLAWLGYDVAGLPSGKLASLQAAARIKATPDLVEIADGDIRLDNTRATLAAAFRLQARPSFGLTLNVDKLNLDGYAALAAPEKAADASAGGKAGSGGQGKPAPPLAVLNTVDANVSFTAGQLSYTDYRVRGVDLSASLVGGKLSVQKLRIEDLAGASIGLAGTAEGFDGVPRVDVKLEGAADDLTGLTRLAGVDMPIPPARLRKAELSAHLVGNTDRATVKASLAAGGALLELNGAAQALLERPAADLTYRLRHGSLAAMAQLLGVELTPMEGFDTPVDLSGRFNGDASAFELELAGTLAEARVSLGGRLGPGATPMTLDLALDVEAKDALKSLRAVGVDYRPSAGVVGGLKLTGKLKGDSKQAAIGDLVIAAGPLNFAGQGGLRLVGERPFISAKLTGGDVLLDPLLPGAAAPKQGKKGGDTRRKARASRWSRERLDLTGLKALDADLEITAKSIVFQRYPFIEPRLHVLLQNGLLEVKSLTGRLFKGDVSLQAAVDGARTPKMELSVRLNDADIRETLVTALEIDQVSGLMSFEGDFKTTGGSQWDLVSNLSGRAVTRARDGSIQGFDMKKFSARLGELHTTADFINLANRTFSGGETRLHSATGTWQVARGVATTKDTQALLDASEASLTGVINLPAWKMDLNAVLRLTEHQDAPDVGAHVYGPLDAPRRDLKTRKLERWLVARAGKEVLRKTLGKEKAGGAGLILDALTGKKSGGTGVSTGTDIIRRQPSTSGDRTIQRRSTQQQPVQEPSTTRQRRTVPQQSPSQQDPATTILRNLLRR
jgi:uncharacterized protein involved in outer membrane biogenesis